MKTKNNIFYQSHFIAERMNAVETYLDELQDTPIYEAAQMILMESTGISQMEAEEIVNGLSEGLGLFKKSALQRDFSPKSLLEITSNLEAGKQHEVLTNMLTAFTMITDANDNKTAESLLEENKGKSVEVLAEELSELMKEGITGEKKTVIPDKYMTETPDILKRCESGNDDICLIIALSIYIEQYNGNLKLSDSFIPSPMIGYLSGSGIGLMEAISALYIKGDDEKEKVPVGIMIAKKILVIAAEIIIFFAFLLILFSIWQNMLSLLGLCLSIIFIILLSLITAYICSDPEEEKMSDHIISIYNKMKGKINCVFGRADETTASNVPVDIDKMKRTPHDNDPIPELA